MSTPTEDGKNQRVSPAGTPLPEVGEFGSFKEAREDIDRAIAAEEQVDPAVLEDQPQPPPPAPEPKKSRFTVVCVCKVQLEGSPDPETRDVAAVHVMGTSIADAKANAVTLLAAHVKQTTLNDWDAVLTYLGHQEILNG